MPELKPGEIIALRYEINELIGEGSFASVYKVFDSKLQTNKALKVFHENNTSAKQNIRSEARILSKLNHPGIVRIYDYSSDKKILFQDMEYIDGSELKDFIRNNKLDLSEKIKLSLALTKALQYAHSKKIIHHDLKPQNILIQKNKNPKITDFGIAEQLSDEIIVRKTAGSKAYMSPEKRKKKHVSPKTDVFSLGIILNEIFNDEYPFQLASDETPDYIIPDKLRKSKDPIDKLITECISLLPDDRPTTTEIHNKLKDILFQKAPSPWMKFYHYLSMLNPFTYADDQTKKDLKILFISLGFLFLLLPFFLKTLQKYHPFERRIQTRFPQSYVSVNFKNPQARPSILDIKYGDSVQIKDTEGNTLFNYRYKGEDHLYFNIDKKNNIILNDEIIGKRILSKNDLPLTNNLEIIHSNIDLLEKDVSNQKNKNLTFSIGKNVNASTISNFPDEIFYLDLSKNIKIEYLKSADNLRKIEILDNSQREINSLFNFSDFENLKQLNLENTNLLQTYVLRTLSKMHHLNLSKNGLSEILAIDKMDFLRTISLDDNYEINDISTLLTRNMLTDYSIKNNYNISENQVDELDKELGRTKITKYLNTREFSQLEVLIFWVFMLIALLLSLISLRIFIRSLVKILKEKPLPLNSEISENIPKSFDRHLEKKQLDLCFKKNQLALPKGDNALERAQAIATIIPKDKEIQKLYKSAYKQSVKKIKNHFKKNEYEPAYLIAQGAFETAKADIFKKWIIKSRKKLLENNHKMKFVKIEGGEFEMGDFTGSLSNAPAHKVKLSSFKISETLVTNKQYCEFLNSKGNLKDAGVNWININSPYSQIEIHNGKFKPKEGYSAFPVFNVAWFGAQRFCNWAGGRLPTEAEYEFVARNRGQKISYSHGNNISRKKANFLVDKNDKNWHSVVPVKSFKANPLKIYDLSGNLLEWCLDNYDSDFYLESSVMNPMGPKANALSRSSEGKVVRGGAWCFEKERMQTYRRGAAKPTTRNNFIGFRVVM